MPRRPRGGSRSPAASPGPPRSTPASSRRTPTGASPAAGRSSRGVEQEVAHRDERVCVVAVVLVHHLAHVIDARVDVRLQLRVVERRQVHVERAMAGDRRRLQLVVPTAHRVAPDALLEGLRGDAGAATELGPDPLGVLGPVRTGQVERLRLVVGEPVDARHREAVEQHAVAAERLLEPAVEPRGVRVLQHRGLRHRVVGAVLLPGPGPRRRPVQCRTHCALLPGGGRPHPVPPH